MFSFGIQILFYTILSLIFFIIILVINKEPRTISKFIFIYFVILQVISIYVGYEIDRIRIIKFSLFQIAFLPSIILVFLETFKYFKKGDIDENKKLIKIIIYYTMYQILVILPLSYIQFGLKPGEIFYQIIPRMYFLLIPFIYWFVVPLYKNINTPIKVIAYSSVPLLILSLYNYINGIYMVTNTGELRLVSGVAAIIFVFTLVTSFSIFSHTKNNVALIAVSLIGLVFVNHRSAYLMLGFVLILSIFISVINTQKNKIKFSRIGASFVIIILLLIPLSQIPLIKENFTGRIMTAFDVEDPNARDRMMRWGLSFAYFLENPVNGSMLMNTYYAVDEFRREQDLYPPHNFIFEILSTQGIVGLLFISFTLYNILRIGYRNKSDPISIQMLLILIFYILYSLLNVTFLNTWNLLVLVFSSAIILARNKQLERPYKIL